MPEKSTDQSTKQNPHASLFPVKVGIAALLALAFFAPACVCSLQSAPKQEAEHSCCSPKKETPAPVEKDGCGKGCNHCKAEFKTQQDQPKESQPVFSQVLLAVPAYADSGMPVPDLVSYVSPVHAGAHAPPGRMPVYLLLCSIVC